MEGQREKSFDEIVAEVKAYGDISLEGRHEEARELLLAQAETSMYHAHLLAVILSTEAGMSLDLKTIERAIKALDHSVEMCNRSRRRHSILDGLANAVAGVDYENFSQKEIHAELCYAEGLFLYAILTFFKNENWVKFIKFGFRARSVYNSYRQCYLIMKKRKWNPDNHMHAQFLTGVYFGVGSFYLLMSLLPEKILSVVRFLGFSGSMSQALAELEKGHNMVSGRAPLCTFALLGYHLLLHELCDVKMVRTDYVGELLKSVKDKFPKGPWTLMFSGRYEMVMGNFGEAQDLYDKAIESKTEWTQMIYVCHWQKLFCHAFVCDWKSGRLYADKLFQEDNWTKSICGYTKACFMYAEKEQLTKGDHEEIRQLMKKIPGWTRKIAGRTPPLEKYVASKAKKYLESNRLIVPIFELVYLWRGFGILAHNRETLINFLSVIERSDRLVESDRQSKFYWEDKAEILLVKAGCLRTLNRSNEAEICLTEALKSENHIVWDKYLVPFINFELGVLYASLGKTETALELFDKILNAKGERYLLHRRLRSRVVGAIREINKKDNTITTEKIDSVENEVLMPELKECPEIKAKGF